MSDVPATVEPNMETAFTWWSELPDIWTPVGWKDHLFRFNVEFNGAIVALPDLNSRTRDWKDQGVQLGIYPTADMRVPHNISLWHDDNSVVQGWNDCAAPVLWSEWATEGLVLREEVFAHIPGAGDVETGVEPLFLWIRLSIHDRCDELPLEDEFGFLIQINAPCIGHEMNARNNTVVIPELSLYPRRLEPETEAYDARSGYRLLEDGGKVRLAIAPRQQCSVSFKSGVANPRNASLYIHSKEFKAKQPKETDSLLHILMDAEKGAHVDLLLPMLPAERDVFDEELALGYDRALAEASRYWACKPSTAGSIETPEQHVNRTIAQSLKFAEVIAEKNRATGQHAMLLGSWSYSLVWATPVSMTSVMLLDTMGYHCVADKYLEIFRRKQGTVVPPGDSFGQHPGYLSTPADLTAIDWLSDHGAILWAVCEHALLSGDEQFIRKWTGSIVKGCEFIKDARRIEGHGGVPGLMPPAAATDSRTQIQAVWNDGWSYKGLTTAVKLLRRIDHPRAEEFESEASDYKETFTSAIREKARQTPTWTDKKGKEHHLVPTAVFGAKKWETRYPFYLDTGPLFLVFSGLMGADDELMRSALSWFREGPQTKMYRYDSNWSQVPCLHHEMSSCEPVYSWNVFHSHQLQDRAKFLEGMYGLFAGYVSRETYTMCEHRGGVCGLTPALLPGYLARLAVIDDQVVDDELHLLRLAPLAWLRTDRESRFEDIPTHFGPVTLAAKLARGGKELQVSYDAKFRTTPKRVVLHVPPVEGLAALTVNGEPVDWDGKKDSLDMP